MINKFPLSERTITSLPTFKKVRQKGQKYDLTSFLKIPTLKKSCLYYVRYGQEHMAFYSYIAKQDSRHSHHYIYAS